MDQIINMILCPMCGKERILDTETVCIDCVPKLTVRLALGDLQTGIQLLETLNTKDQYLITNHQDIIKVIIHKLMILSGQQFNSW